MQREEALEALRGQCLGCQRCQLGKTRRNLVFGDGNPGTGILFVGEGPGAQEDEQGIPFVGAAGQFLTQMLDIIGLDRTKYYIANIVKCRPPGNRDPQGPEQEACVPWLQQQIDIIQPKILICLGRISAMRFISEDYRITRQHGQWVQKNGMWITAIYHPSALLRDLTKRPETFDDLKSIQAKIREVCPGVLPV